MYSIVCILIRRVYMYSIVCILIRRVYMYSIVCILIRRVYMYSIVCILIRRVYMYSTVYMWCKVYRIVEHFRGKKCFFRYKMRILWIAPVRPIIMWVWPQNVAEKTFTDGSDTAKNTKVFQCTVSYCMCREKHEGFPMYSIMLYVPRKTRRFSNVQYYIVCAAKNTKVFQCTVSYCMCRKTKNTKVFHCTVSYCMCRGKHEGFPMYSIILYVP